jgi:hypothetical protein
MKVRTGACEAAGGPACGPMGVSFGSLGPIQPVVSESQTFRSSQSFTCLKTSHIADKGERVHQRRTNVCKRGAAQMPLEKG